ncbi:hypothetical protein M0P48_00185 [Candidatus Gracilibacteria bacterium]|nr:hypothetical protein [Candidatus Gracilibacteria bacterium]
MKSKIYIILQVLFIVIALLYTFRPEWRSWQDITEKYDNVCGRTLYEFTLLPNPIPFYSADSTEQQVNLHSQIQEL